MDSASSDTASANDLAREFFAAIDARDPRRLRAVLANNASFRALPHREVIRPADEIVAYFGTVVSSYPTARWEVTDVISDGERAAVQFTLREFAPAIGRELLSEQMAVMRTSGGKITSVVGYYDAEEFRGQFWADSVA
ncbi:MAG: nuclear transport factor 2 family protein [Thermomicrobiales bacterium]|nr:nuclear transport factor 2 family protein [Chloroflexia bacterium]